MADPDALEAPPPAGDPSACAAPARGRPAEAVLPDLDRLVHEPLTDCLNCGADLPGAYCPGCGQRAERLRQPVHLFLKDAAVEFLGFDGRVWVARRPSRVRPRA